VRGAEDAPAELRKVTAELQEKNLNEMLEGSTTSPLGIAGQLLDRLALRYPRISAIRVDCSDGTAGEIRRAPRQL
jgi:hypothetical protein